jgi:succinoglycan biosynthesis protein ExoA
MRRRCALSIGRSALRSARGVEQSLAGNPEARAMTARMVENARDASARVLVVIPCLNEEKHVEGVVEGLLAEADRVAMTIVVADGRSSDGTRAVVEQLAKRDTRIVLLDNPKRIQSAALNLAVRRHGDGASHVLRVDAHAGYPERYCERLLATQVETGADSVVVSMRTEGRTCFERAAAAAQNSILGNGGSAHRNATIGRWVDHGHHALMTLAAYRAIGGYDESFSHNEDVEFDLRLRESGFRIFLIGGMAISYFPRRNPVALFKQYFKIGRGRARNVLKHRRHTKLRHLILAAVAPILCLLLLAPLSAILAAPALCWAALCLGYGVLIGVRLRDLCAAGAGFAAIATQAGWSFGFHAGLASGLAERISKRWGRGAAPGPERIAR